MITNSGEDGNSTGVVWKSGRHIRNSTTPYFMGLDCDRQYVNIYKGSPKNPGEWLWREETLLKTSGDRPYSLSDPSGDHPLLDMVNIQALEEDGNLKVNVTFKAPPPTFFVGLMAIDLDQNPSTTAKDLTVAGAEGVVQFTYQEFSGASLTLTTARGSQKLNNGIVDINTLSYEVPLNLLENDSSMDLFWAFSQVWGTFFDRAPDVGVFAMDTGSAVVRKPGNNSIQVDIDDPTSSEELAFPNQERLQVKVVGDQLQLILTYAHSVEDILKQIVGDGMWVYVSLDADKTLCTGFATSGLPQPSLGVDHELRLVIDPITKIGASLWSNSDGDGFGYEMAMGLPANDMFMQVEGKKIICKIPLAYLSLSYLGNYGGGGEITVTSVSAEDITDPDSLWDRVPDSGSWDLQRDMMVPMQQCMSDQIRVEDPDNDSLLPGGGLDNDEFTVLEACLGRNAILLQIEYLKYQTSSDGPTFLYIDTDQDSSTGELFTNIAGDTQIGAEYVLFTYFDGLDGLKQWTYLRNVNAKSTKLTDQFTLFTLANRIYLSIPFDCIGNPVGNFDLMLQTFSWGAGPLSVTIGPYDNLPDQGVVTLLTNQSNGIPNEGTPTTTEGATTTMTTTVLNGNKETANGKNRSKGSKSGKRISSRGRRRGRRLFGGYSDIDYQ